MNLQVPLKIDVAHASENDSEDILSVSASLR